MRKSFALLLLITFFALSACTWVELTPSGKKVRVLELQDVASCKRLGKTSASVLAKAAGIQRRGDKVAEELAALASNTAADMGGDTIVPTSEVVDGKQNFDIYRCVNPEGM